MKDLRFYNKEGYPYNFLYNEINEIYEGKLFFDENSTDTFKTKCIYTFENIPEKSINKQLSLSHNEYYNYNGIHIKEGESKEKNILNIKNVNKSPNYYSKWIIGKNFDNLFPIGSFVTIENVDNDYNNDFIILDNKPDSVMIFGLKDNSINYSFGNTGTIKTSNKIIYCDKINDNSFKKDGKFTIINSINNDGIFTINDIKNYDIDYNSYKLPTIVKNTPILSFNIELKTERPKLLTSDINYTLSNDINGDAKILNLKLNSNFKLLNKNDDLSLNLGSSFYLEDFYDNQLLKNASLTIKEMYNHDIYKNLSVSFDKSINKTNTFNKIFNSGNNYEYPSDDLFKNVPEHLKVYDYNIILNNLNEEISLFLDDKIVLNTISDIISIKNNCDKQFTIISSNYKDGKQTIQIEEPLNILETESFKQNNNYQINNVINHNGIYYISKDTFTSNLSFDINDWDFYNIVDVKHILNYINEMVCESSKILLQTDIPVSETGTVFYGTSNNFKMQQEVLLNEVLEYDWVKTISALKNKYKNTLSYYNIDLFYENDEIDDFITFENIYPVDDYFDISDMFLNYDISGKDELIKTPKTKEHTLISVNEKLKDEIIKKGDDETSKNYKNTILFDLKNDNFNKGINIIINGYEYSTTFINDTKDTLEQFILENNSKANTNNISFEIENDNKLIINGLFPSISIYELFVSVNLFSKYTMLTDNFINNNGLFMVSTKLQLNNSDTSLISDGFVPGMVASFGDDTIFKQNEYTLLNVYNNKMYISYSGYLYKNISSKLLNTYVDDTLKNISKKSVTLNTREFLQKPRYPNNKYIKYRFRWSEDIDKSIFFYDFSGEHDILKNGPVIDGRQHTELKYTGIKPLTNSKENLYLIKEPNLLISKTNEPNFQQTIFENIDLYVDTSNDIIDVNPEPLQLNIGFNSKIEGVNKKHLYLEEIIDKELSLTTLYKNDNIRFKCVKNDLISYIELTNLEDESFSFFNYGFETNHKIRIKIENISNIKNNRVFENYEDYTITSINNNKLYLDNSKMTNTFKEFDTNDYLDDGVIFNISIQNLPKILLTCPIYGESEGEDIRLKTNLSNLGIKIDSEDVQIFKETDVDDDGIDYKVLNRKRKEMLLIYPEIYNYIGSYKSLINAINYFGYNDLEVNEYYKNIDINSPLYEKLQKVSIKGMFDSSFEGWIDNKDFNKNHLFKTNLFNLTYRITDEYGNNVQMYNNNEVIKKLNSLKKWLKTHIMPLNTKFLDITGISSSLSSTSKKHITGYNVIKHVADYKSTVVNFFTTETKNFDNNYLLTVNFYTNNDTIPTNGWSCKIKTYSKNKETNKLDEEQYIKFHKTDLSSFSFSYNKDIDPFVYIETLYYNEYGLATVNKNLRNVVFSRDYFLVNNNMKMYNYLDPSKNSPSKNGDYGYIDTGNGFYYTDEYGHMFVDYENI